MHQATWIIGGCAFGLPLTARTRSTVRETELCLCDKRQEKGNASITRYTVLTTKASWLDQDSDAASADHKLQRRLARKVNFTLQQVSDLESTHGVDRLKKGERFRSDFYLGFRLASVVDSYLASCENSLQLSDIRLHIFILFFILFTHFIYILYTHR